MDPRTISDAQFDQWVGDALDGVPEQLAREMANIVVLVEDANPDGLNVLGLYQGVALTERTTHYAGYLPDSITIYRHPLIRMCRDQDELVAQIRITVIHEIGHHFGIDDARLHELGWG